MLKPLLRTLAPLSGNVKLACSLSDYSNLTTDIYECYVRSARLLPLTSSLAQSQCSVSLVDSSYEFDLKKFYGKYSQYFFTDCYDYNKIDYPKIDKYNTQSSRNTDFEFGLKRVSYVKNEAQFAFYAPIYIESNKDIPDYFLISIDIKNEYYTVSKSIKVNIGSNSDSIYNYLYKYINKYASKIDSNVIYCLPKTQQATYYGINLSAGGFAKKVDNLFGKNYYKQSTIQNFDAVITNGWKRIGMCMKQIIPLAFYFNINDILTDAEKEKFTNSECTISGVYYKDGEKVAFYDIDTDYTVLNQDVLKMNDKGIIDYVTTNINILDVQYPSLNEVRYYGYRYSNKVSKIYNRWKLKYSSDDAPYITNMSWAFSYNQGSTYKYGEFPETFSSLNIISDYTNNLIFPIGNAATLKTSPYYGNYSLINNYNTIMNNYASTWFNLTKGIDTYVKVFVNNVVDIKDDTVYCHISDDGTGYIPYTDAELTEIKVRLQLPKRNKNHLSSITMYVHSSIWNDTDWIDIEDNKAYCKGILYDLSNIYAAYPNIEKIDKFNVYVQVHFNPVKQDLENSIKTAKYVIYNNGEYISNRNCFVSSTVMKSMSGGEFNNSVNSFYISEDGLSVKNELTDSKLFIEETSDKDGDFIDLLNYNYNYYDVNKYYKLSEINEILTEDETGFPYNIEDLFRNTLNVSQYYVSSYELLPIYRLGEIYNDDNKNFIEQNAGDNTEWLRTNLHFSHFGNQYKSQYSRKVVNSLYEQYGNETNAIPLYLSDTFITYTGLRTILYENLTNDVADKTAMSYISYLTEYEFKPIVKRNDDVCAKNVFERRDTFNGRQYGDMIPTSELKNDNDVIFVDQYNMNNVISEYNRRFDTSIPKYTNDESEASTSYELLDEINSTELYAKVLNENHLRYYISNIYKDFNNEGDMNEALPSLYIKKRMIINEYETHNIFVKDQYISLRDFYLIDLHALLTDDDYNKTYYDTVVSLLSDSQIADISNLDEEVYIKITDIYENDFEEYINSIFYTDGSIDLDKVTAYKNQCFNITSSDIMNDIEYSETGYWMFSKEFNSTHDIDGLAGIDDFDDTTTSTFKFELYYKKNFIKVNKNLFSLINVNESSSNPYKDLYLFTLGTKDDYNSELKYYYTEDLDVINTTYELTYWLKPLFNDVFMQNKKETAVYKEYSQNRIYPTTYMYAENTYGEYYRYNTANTVMMFDMSTYPEDAYPIIGHDVFTGEQSYYYSKSYISSYQEATGFDLLSVEGNKQLVSYTMIDTCYSYMAAPSTYTSTLESYVAYSYTDYAHPQKGYKVSYTYYAPEVWSRKTAKVNPYKRWSYISDITDAHYGSYTVWDAVPYTYYIDYEEKAYRYTYDYKIYDDLGLYDKYKLNTYTVASSYTYSYLTNVETTEHIESTDGSFIAYDVTYYTPTYAVGYGTSYTTYGFFYIDAFLDNTSASVNIVDTNYQDKKFFTYINEANIYDETFDIDKTFKYLVPFTQLQLFQTLNRNNTTIIKPTIFNQDIYYRQSPLYDATGVEYAYDITLHTKRQGITSLERYFDSIVPYIKETGTIKNSYNVKYKDTDLSMKVSYTDDVIYNADLSIYRYSPLRVYDMDANYTSFYPVEYKYFNDNVVYNLEEEINIHISDKLTSTELDNLKTDEHIIEAFKNYLNNGKKHDFTDDEILFLYNRYDVQCESVCVGLNITKTGKLYSLTYKFTLL